MTRVPGTRMGKYPVERLIEKVHFAESGCWEWIGKRFPNGYGQITWRFNGQPKCLLAHRLAYTLMVGPIPDGLVLDHLCRVKWCVNPDHLEPVAQRTNVMRGLAPFVNGQLRREVTHCKRGHPIDGLHGNGKRYCKTCALEAHRKWDRARAHIRAEKRRQVRTVSLQE